MVDGGNSAFRATDFQPTLLQPVESLGRSNLMDQMQINVQDCRGAGLVGDDMALPDLFEKGF